MLNAQSENPDLWNDPTKAQALMPTFSADHVEGGESERDGASGAAVRTAGYDGTPFGFRFALLSAEIDEAKLAAAPKAAGGGDSEVIAKKDKMIKVLQ